MLKVLVFLVAYFFNLKRLLKMFEKGFDNLVQIHLHKVIIPFIKHFHES